MGDDSSWPVGIDVGVFTVCVVPGMGVITSTVDIPLLDGAEVPDGLSSTEVGLGVVELLDWVQEMMAMTAINVQARYFFIPTNSTLVCPILDRILKDVPGIPQFF